MIGSVDRNFNYYVFLMEYEVRNLESVPGVLSGNLFRDIGDKVIREGLRLMVGSGKAFSGRPIEYENGRISINMLLEMYNDLAKTGLTVYSCCPNKSLVAVVNSESRAEYRTIERECLEMLNEQAVRATAKRFI